MNGLVMAAQLIAGLSILVLIHEFGHYIAAIAFKIKVDKFYLFFDAWGFKLFKFKKGNTEYGIGWLPLGGYVKIAGMVDESMDKEQLKQPVQPWEFRAKPAWQRLIVMLAGVIMNTILGIIIFTAILMYYGKHYLPNEEIIDGIYAYQSGRDVGFKTGDKIISLNGNILERFSDVTSTRVLFGAKITINRNGKILDILLPDTLYKSFKDGGKEIFINANNYPLIVENLVPGKGAEKGGMLPNDKIISLDTFNINCFGDFSENIHKYSGKTVVIKVIRSDSIIPLNVFVDKSDLIGISHKMPYKITDYNFLSALKFGYSDAIEVLSSNAKGLGKVVSGKIKARDSFGGPIAIAQIYGAIWDWSKFWFITGLLSMILALMNILPIPALDGGHVIFLIIEAVSGRKFSDNFMEKAQIVGMIIIFSLMVFAIGNDLFKLFQ
jgi:regulator of sigma E protease